MLIAVAGTRPVLRRGIVLLLADVPGWTTHEVSDLDGPHAPRSLREADVAVIDVHPFLNRLPLVRRVSMAGTPVVALAASASTAHVTHALAAGAVACLRTEDSAELIVATIRDARSPEA